MLFRETIWGIRAMWVRGGICRLLFVAISAALALMSPAAAGELFVMPFTCSAQGNRPVVTPSSDQGYSIIGRKEQRSFSACSPSNPELCKQWTVYRFDVNCGGVRMPWVSVASAISGTRNRRAWTENGRMHIEMPARWSAAQDDPCARQETDNDDWRGSGFARFCAERQANVRGPVVEIPDGFAPMMGLEPMFVADRGAPGGGDAEPFGHEQGTAPTGPGPFADAGPRSSAQPGSFADAGPPPSPQPAPYSEASPAPLPKAAVDAGPATQSPPTKAAKAASAKSEAPPRDTAETPLPPPPKPVPVTKKIEAQAKAEASPFTKPELAAKAVPAVSAPAASAPDQTLPMMPTVINKPGASKNVKAPGSETDQGTTPSTAAAPSSPAADAKAASPAAPAPAAPSPAPSHADAAPTPAIVTASIDAPTSGGDDHQALPKADSASVASFKLPGLGVALTPTTAAGVGMGVLALAALAMMLWRDRSSYDAESARDIATVSFDDSAGRGVAKREASAVFQADRSAPPDLSPAGSQGARDIGSDIPKTREEALMMLGMGVAPDLNEAAIKKIVDGLRQSWHPDYAKGEAERQLRELRMKQINAAWSIISGKQGEPADDATNATPLISRPPDAA